MNIRPLNTNINFSSITRRVFCDNKTGEKYQAPNNWSSPEDTFMYSNYTHFFREDINDGNWNKFRKKIVEHFSDCPKVNTYNFGSSDGSEAYSLVVSLIEELAEESQKFFPIATYDIDDEMVKVANSGILMGDIEDVKNIRLNCNNQYFTITSKPHREYNFDIEVDENIKNKVEFQVGNFLDMIDEIEPSNSLILCRNFLPYIDYEQRVEAIQKLSQRLDTTSLVVIGNFDESKKVNETLKRFGFREIAPLIYRKTGMYKILGGYLENTQY